MTSKQGPVHTYVVVLFLFEFVIGIATAAVIIIVFTYAPTFADTFWWSATPVEWFVWALCITLLGLRLHIVIKVELPALGRSLRSMESQRWMESSDHAAPNVVGANLRKPLSEPYQYYSWKFAASVVLISSALLAVGLRVDRLMLYDLAVFAGYLLFQVVVRLSIEVLWRLPMFRKYRMAISR